MKENEILVENLDSTEELHISDVIESVCPECRKPLIEKWSGVKCNECGYWECY
ncbi:MAG: hypothetical protein H0X63_00125 [Flavobacteriales bacterium]|nr:hypothetical protein [Flavobacteriales bacterium]